MARSFDTKKRNKETRKRIPVVIIVAEGKNATEVQYLGSFNKQHSKYSIKAMNAGHDTDPQGLLKTAKKAWKDKELDANLGDKAYIFMDLDCSDMRVNKIVEQIPNAGNIEFILSNPCFEQWFLLHYEYTTHVFLNNDELINRLKKYIPNYEKALDVTEKLAPYLSDALDRAKKLRLYHAGKSWPSTDCNPMTDVDKVILEISQSDGGLPK